MHSRVTKFACAAAALSLIVTPTMASAATKPVAEPMNALVVVSAFGNEASSQAVQPAVTSATAAASMASMAQAGDPPPGAHYGINWILLGLGAFFFLAGIYTLFADDDDDGRVLPVSPD